MKTTEDYIKQINDHLMPHPYNLYLFRKQREELKSLIKEIQKEAYNQALEDATEKVIMKLLNGIIVIDKDSILKLKK